MNACRHCGAQLAWQPSFCSKACNEAWKKAYRNERIPTTCAGCGVEFMGRRGQAGRTTKYHSVECRTAHWTATGRFAGANNPRWLGGVSKLPGRYRRARARATPIQRAVYNVVGYAIQRGRLRRQPCEECGATKVVAHHADYLKPLDVRWLCDLHHRRWHSENGPGANIDTPPPQSGWSASGAVNETPKVDANLSA